MPDQDYYQMLGVSPLADLSEIRSAYHRLARRVHPDTNPEWEDDQKANRQMALLNEAYDVLGDPLRRAEYDRGRHGHSGSAADQVCYYETPGYTPPASWFDSYRRTQEPPPTEKQEDWPVRTYARPAKQMVIQVAAGTLFALAAIAVVIVLYCLDSRAVIPAFFVVAFGSVFSFICMLNGLLLAGSYTELQEDKLATYWFGRLLRTSYRYEDIKEAWGERLRIGPLAFRYVAIGMPVALRHGDAGYVRVRLARIVEHESLLHELGLRCTGKPGVDRSSKSVALSSWGFACALIWAIGMVLVVLGGTMSGWFSAGGWPSVAWVSGAALLCLCSFVVFGF